jgi:hypothetical protein
MLDEFSPCERDVLWEIARRRGAPSLFQSVLDIVGMPFEVLWAKVNSWNPKLSGRVQDKVNDKLRVALIQAVQFGTRHISEKMILDELRKNDININEYEAVKSLELECLDRVATRATFANGAMATGEGLAAGILTLFAEGFPGAQVALLGAIGTDVTLITMILARQACQIGASYGFSTQDVRNYPHFLSAMSPSEPGEIIGTKMAAAKVMDEIGAYVGKRLSRQQLASFTDRLIPMLVQRLGLVIGEKELAMLVPVLGIAFNATVSQQLPASGFDVAKDYFRLLLLGDRYGTKILEEALSECERALENTSVA